MIAAKNISLFFGHHEIFNDISFNIAKNQRIGLVGRNGSGKSTLLRVLNRQQLFDNGQLLIEKSTKIAYFPQELVLISQRSILEETLTIFGNLIDLKNEFDSLKNVFDNKPPQTHEKIERFSLLQHTLNEHMFDKLIAEAKKMLNQLGFDQDKLYKPVNELSAGWKMRIVLAKLLLQKADFYLFDEPTNHLDIVAKDWFLTFLKQSNSGFILISHDRYFLDSLCQHIFTLNQGELKIYRGNYTNYCEQKEKDDELLLTQYDAQQKHIKKTMATINRFRAKASKASMVQSMLKSIKKLELISIDPKASDVKLNFSYIKQSGKVVINVQNLCKYFNSKLLFKNISFDIMRDDKVALIAANGKGKTTLLNLIAGKYLPENGIVKFGHNVKTAFFEQDQELILDKNRTILEEIEGVCTTTEIRQRVRSLLGAFLFSGDDVEKKINVLSGGEKNRVAMIKTLLQNANFLILDEPTNHLDIQTKEILLRALKQYSGTILFVSHDRFFVDGLATKILELNSDGVINYPGNYESFLYYKKQPENQQQNLEQNQTKIKQENTISKSGKELYELRKKINGIERKIELLENNLTYLNQKIEILEYGTQEFNDSYKKINEIKKQLEPLYKKWEDLQINTE